jgi:hypothetical protein
MISIDSVYKSMNVLTTIAKSKKGRISLTPLVRNSEILEGYFLDQDGNPWSNKKGSFVPLTPNYSGDYPTICPSIDGVNSTERLHRMVAETLVPFPRPAEISREDWKATPEASKQIIKRLYFVNHIDHDKNNFHPSNLEWVTSTENARAYQKHRMSLQ